MHVNPGYPLYCEEAWGRALFYPPTAGTSSYWLGWLWLDGSKDAGYAYPDWRMKIVDRMNQPSPVTITMWGDTSETSDTIYAQFRNDSSATLNGRVHFVITEDSIYYPSPNGDMWHNHVARDYLPTDTGTPVSIPSGDSITVFQPYTIDVSWNANRCEIVTWIQNSAIQLDYSTIRIWQGGIIKVVPGVEEEHNEEVPLRTVTALPNPCSKGINFKFQMPRGVGYRIDIFDVSGRLIRTLNGVSSGNQESIWWNRRNSGEVIVGAGIYFYRLKSSKINTSGKIVVR